MKSNNKFLSTAIVSDTSSLRSATGFWSNRIVYHNPTNDIVITEALSIDSIKAIIDSSFNLNTAISTRLNQCCGKAKPSQAMQEGDNNIKNYFDAQGLPTFQGKAFRASGTRHGKLSYSEKHRVSWIAIGKHLEQQKLTRDKEIEFLAHEIASAYNAGLMPIKYAKGLGADWLQLTHPGLSKLLDKEYDTNQFLKSLTIIKQFHIPKAANQDIKKIIEANQPVMDVVSHYQISIANLQKMIDVRWLLSLSHSAGLLLSLLSIKRCLILPANWSGLTYTRLCAPEWFVDGDKHIASSLLGKILISTTIDTLEDIPVNIHNWLDGIGYKQMLNTLFKPRLLAHQLQHDLSAWPVTQLHRNKSRRNKNTKIWTPQWLQENGYSDTWVAFVTRHWEINQTGDHQLKDTLRGILIWCKGVGIESPADIGFQSLRDVFNPDRKDTFFWFIQNESMGDKWKAWASPSAAFKRVVNSLKVDPHPLLPPFENPFELLENPFRCTSNNKTIRKRLPSSIHEAMIEVLMETDEHGIPTYRWVKENLKWDWFEQVNQRTSKIERIWCPSRSACLALLLLLPIRKKQARWLDRGLMDKNIWDIETGQWKKNSHPLVKWRNPNGISHIELYNRNSGILQPLFDPLIDRQELGLFINTNKTQMWNPENITGYELPWPSVEHITDSLAKESTNIQWLERPYTVLKQQISWQNKNNNHPTPVSAMDLTEDACSQNAATSDRLPYFCPVFADMTTGFPSHSQQEKVIYGPVASRKLTRLFHALSVETERRLKAQGINVVLTKPSLTKNTDVFEKKVGLFDIHSLRVAGISRLIEIGVPAHIVQEFVVGHATLAMTHYYKKHDHSFLRTTLLDAVSEKNVLGDFDSLKHRLTSREDLFVSSERYKKHRPDALLGTYTGWIFVPGGICPLGGTGCDTGQPIELVSPNGRESQGYGPVKGGCGNCRFFSTGPAFIIHQAQTTNEIMLQARAIGKTRKALYKRLSEIEWDSDESQKNTLNTASIKDQITDIDQQLEPLILEWFNRYQMFEESLKLLTRWDEFIEQEKRETESKPLILLSGADDSDVVKELDIRLQNCGDFTLVRSILEGAKIRGGLEKASSLAKDKMREFMDMILRSENSSHLLLDIPDEKTRNDVALHIAALAQHLVGDVAVQKALDNHSDLGLSDKQRANWKKLTREIFTDGPINEKQITNLLATPAFDPLGASDEHA